MDLQHFGNVLIAVMFIVSVAVAAWGALNRETLKTVRESNKDLIERVGILEATETRHTAELATLTSENETLRSVITNESHLVAIEGMIEDHHRSAEAWWDRLSVSLDAIRVSLERPSS